EDISAFLQLVDKKIDAQIQARVAELRTQFQQMIGYPEQRKEFVYLLARFVKSFHFLNCFLTFPKEIEAAARFAEYAGPQLIKQGTVSEWMNLVGATEVSRASVKYLGEQQAGVTNKIKSGTGGGGGPPLLKKVSIQDMIAEIRERYAITDEEALYIREVTDEK